jgi:hypothetical protein
MAVVAGEKEEWRHWQRATMGVVVLDNIDDKDCDGAMDSNYKDDNCDGAMEDYDGDNDDGVDGNGTISNNDDNKDSEDNVVVRRLRISDGDDTGSASSLTAGGRVIN